MLAPAQPAESPEVSFILPAFNEERAIALALTSIRSAMAGGRSFEVIVGDHGSTDGTARVAAEGGARVVPLADARNIAELRNRAAAGALGRLLVFLDADVVLGPDWGNAFAAVCQALADDAMVITGSRLLVPTESGWVARTWFPPSQGGRHASHVGSGHMIMTRGLFRLIGGFRPELDTGEDYAICMDAKRRGANIVNNPALVAYHLGAPQTLAAFWRREVWHGRGDARDLKKAASSRVVWSTAAFAAAHGILFFALLGAVSSVYAPVALGLIVGLASGSAVRRMGPKSARILLRGSLLFYIYYWARACALIAAVAERSPGTRSPRGAEKRVHIP